VASGRSLGARNKAGVAYRQAPLFIPSYPQPAESLERKGVVYTKPWVVELLLDLADYRADRNLVDCFAVEPASGEGAFLIPMAERLVRSCQKQGRSLGECKRSLMAFELEERSATTARKFVTDALKGIQVQSGVAEELACSWIRVGDYLLEAFSLPRADFVIGNPPYVRLENIPDEVANIYRRSYPTMRGRADIYVGFYEAALRSLKEQGVCAFICADRWMLNQYGAELRSFVTSNFAVEAVIEMHNAAAFEDDVSAYPAITLIRRNRQRKAVVARAEPEAETIGGAALAEAVKGALTGEKGRTGLSLTVVKSWFKDDDPWPCSSPCRIAILRRLEEAFGPLETVDGATKVGIGVATGLDEVFITRNSHLVEPSRLLSLALAKDTLSGYMKWSGHYLVDPWDKDGLVDLQKYPKLRAYFQQHADLVQRRNTAEKNPGAWYRTIDRVNHVLTKRLKLYIPDIKNEFNPVLDQGETYPHHNLYFVLSDVWDLEVLGGILLSAVGQFFIECYGVRMRGGYLRFQAQYLRRIRVPNPSRITGTQRVLLVKAFRERDRALATEMALEIYQIKPSEMERMLEH
jgi:adenine-specific DNA-methyltransferase